MAGGRRGSLAELDLRAERSRRRSHKRRAQLRHRRATKRAVRRPVLLSVGLLFLTLAAVGGPRGVAEAQRLVSPAASGARCPLPADLRPAFSRAAHDTGISLSLLVSVAHVESRFDTNARSGAGAVGVLQVMPATAAALRLDPNEPQSNVLAGARYLKQMLDRYHSTDVALAAYNAGPTAVDRAGGVAPTEETVAYVANVQQRWNALSGCR